MSGVVLEPGDSVVSGTVWTPRGAYSATGKAEKARLITQSFWIVLGAKKGRSRAPWQRVKVKSAVLGGHASGEHFHGGDI